jgi:hypothetical protein
VCGLGLMHGTFNLIRGPRGPRVLLDAQLNMVGLCIDLIKV